MSTLEFTNMKCNECGYEGTPDTQVYCNYCRSENIKGGECYLCKNDKDDCVCWRCEGCATTLNGDEDSMCESCEQCMNNCCECSECENCGNRDYDLSTCIHCANCSDCCECEKCKECDDLIVISNSTKCKECGLCNDCWIGDECTHKPKKKEKKTTKKKNHGWVALKDGDLVWK